MASSKEDKHEGLTLVAKIKANKSTAICYIYYQEPNDFVLQQ